VEREDKREREGGGEGETEREMIQYGVTLTTLC
jgi:hypothetical protein